MADIVTQEDFQELKRVLRAKNKELKVFENIEGAVRAIDALQEKHNSLDSRISALTVSYNSLSQRVVDTEKRILEARAEADNIVRAAKDEAEIILRDAKARANDVLTSAQESTDSLVSKASNQIKSERENADQELAKMMKAISEKDEEYQTVVRLRDEKEALIALNNEEGAKLEKIRRDLAAILNAQKN